MSYLLYFKKFKSYLTFERFIFSLLILSAFWLRFVNLNFSDYQGDEIKALWSPKSDQAISSYLLNQRKGPMQFIFTWGLKDISGNYSSYFIARFPFALAGFLSVVLVYFIALKFFNNKVVAYTAAFIFSFNGFFIAFSRIIQYQSLVIFFGLLAVFFILLSLENQKYKKIGLILGLVSWGLSILSHYDALLFFPIIFYLLFVWFQKYKDYKFFLVSIFTFLILVCSFYVPYVLNPKFKNISLYLQNRVSGELGVQPKLPTMELFKIYNPKIVLTFYIILLVIGILTIKKSWPIFLWFIPAFIVMEFFVKLPGTHIYIYLIPLVFLCGAGIGFIYQLGNKYLKVLLIVFLTLVFIFNFYQSNFVFVDTSKNYPYDETKFLIWNLPRPNANYSLPLFGFPYNRNWQEISSYIKSKNPNAVFSSNEEKQITRFYLKGHKRSPKNTDYYIRVLSPQSFVNDTNRTGILQIIKSMEPEKVFYQNNKPIVQIYHLKSLKLIID